MLLWVGSEAELDAFRNDPESTVLLVSMRSGGGAAGLTLTMATYGFILEPSLNVGIEDQAVGRLHRIGQRRDVTVYRLLTNNTIEGKIIEMQAQKRRAAARGSQAVCVFKSSCGVDFPMSCCGRHAGAESRREGESTDGRAV